MRLPRAALFVSLLLALPLPSCRRMDIALDASVAAGTDVGHWRAAAQKRRQQETSRLNDAGVGFRRASAEGRRRLVRERFKALEARPVPEEGTDWVDRLLVYDYTAADRDDPGLLALLRQKRMAPQQSVSIHALLALASLRQPEAAELLLELAHSTSSRLLRSYALCSAGHVLDAGSVQTLRRVAADLELVPSAKSHPLVREAAHRALIAMGELPRLEDYRFGRLERLQRKFDRLQEKPLAPIDCAEHEWIDRTLIYGFGPADREDPEVLAYLRGKWTSGDPNEALPALLSLGALGQKDTLPALVDLLEEHPNGNVRSAAALVLGLLGDPWAVPYLQAALDDDFFVKNGCIVISMVNNSARVSLHDLGFPEPLSAYSHQEALETLRAHFSAVQAISRSAEHLAQSPWIVKFRRDVRDMSQDDRLVACLRRLAGSADPVVAVHAQLILAKMGRPEALEPLVALLRSHPNGHVRAAAAETLGLLADRRAVPALQDALSDPYEAEPPAPEPNRPDPTWVPGPQLEACARSVLSVYAGDEMRRGKR